MEPADPPLARSPKPALAGPSPQGEQLCQTNYQQYEPAETVEGMRGSDSEAWNIYWISAHFLTAATEFERLGVNWRRFRSGEPIIDVELAAANRARSQGRTLFVVQCNTGEIEATARR